MTRRFSDHELYVLRNDIPIDILIREKLKIPNKIREGFFRFLCPRCGEFNTSVKIETNRAKCFSCGKCFNTIDMVMVAENYNFVRSVKFLKEFHDQLLKKGEANKRTEPINFNTVNFDSDAGHRKCKKPMPIGKILQNMFDIKLMDDSVKYVPNPIEQKSHLMTRLTDLENQVSRLSLQINQLYSFLDIERQ